MISEVLAGYPRPVDRVLERQEHAVRSRSRDRAAVQDGHLVAQLVVPH
jgi:hypothetical protein